MHEMSDATTRWAGDLEAAFFRSLNALVGPAVRAGCAAPGLFPTGMVVLETTGATTGRRTSVPLMGTVLDGCLFVGTARGDRSQWFRNIRTEPRVRYRLAGRERQGTALVFAAGMLARATQRLPPLARAVAEDLLPAATVCGWQFAVISPVRAADGSAAGAAP
jgi:deazaflavin-dependent oxidoreductase (nitroreductase family)